MRRAEFKARWPRSPAGLIEIGENGQVQICTEAPPLTFQILLLYMKKFVESNLLECLLLACPTNSNSLYQICDGPDQFLMVRTKVETRARSRLGLAVGVL